jgi:hypothetical protein
MMWQGSRLLVLKCQLLHSFFVNQVWKHRALLFMMATRSAGMKASYHMKWYIEALEVIMWYDVLNVSSFLIYLSWEERMSDIDGKRMPDDSSFCA